MKHSWSSIRTISGITLVELLVSLTIISLLIGVSIASYTRFNDRQDLQSAGQTVKNLIRDAQSRAYTGEVSCSVCDCTVQPSLSGWRVDFVNNRIEGVCSSGTTFTPVLFNIGSDHLTITRSVTTPATVLFTSVPPSVDNPATLCLSSSRLSNTYFKIVVTNTGMVADQGIVNSCP